MELCLELYAWNGIYGQGLLLITLIGILTTIIYTCMGYISDGSHFRELSNDKEPLIHAVEVKNL